MASLLEFPVPLLLHHDQSVPRTSSEISSLRSRLSLQSASLCTVQCTASSGHRFHGRADDNPPRVISLTPVATLCKLPARISTIDGIVWCEATCQDQMISLTMIAKWGLVKAPRSSCRCFEPLISRGGVVLDPPGPSSDDLLRKNVFRGGLLAFFVASVIFFLRAFWRILLGTREEVLGIGGGVMRIIREESDDLCGGSARTLRFSILRDKF